MRRALHGLALAGLLVAASALAQPATPPASSAYAQRYAALCAACHGAQGRSELPGTPSLAGQPSFYAITQLFLFRAGRRDNAAMSAIARELSDDDLRGFSDYIATLPADKQSPPPATDAARFARGQQLGQQHLCASCHGADYTGGEQVPRLARQREDYLALVLRGFREGSRLGYTNAMNEAVGRLTPEELDTLAYFLARVPAAR